MYPPVGKELSEGVCNVHLFNKLHNSSFSSKKRRSADSTSKQIQSHALLEVGDGEAFESAFRVKHVAKWYTRVYNLLGQRLPPG